MHADIPLTTPALLARALGHAQDSGPHACFYCGHACDGSHAVHDYISGCFTGWSAVARPDSLYVCSGCVLATRESVELDGYDKPQRMRSMSWVITSASARHYSKGRIADLRAVLLDPPEPPFSLVLAVSGQKHIIYLSPVNQTRGVVTVQFELERVTYRPAALAERIRLCTQIAAATGKPALSEPPTASLAVRLAQYYGGDIEPLMIWFDQWQSPLSRLAAYLTPRKEDCVLEYPGIATGV